jgi:hypothetical protein
MLTSHLFPTRSFLISTFFNASAEKLQHGLDTRSHVPGPVVNDERDVMKAAGALPTSKRLNVSDRDLRTANPKQSQRPLANERTIDPT